MLRNLLIVLLVNILITKARYAMPNCGGPICATLDGNYKIFSNFCELLEETQAERQWDYELFADEDDNEQQIGCTRDYRPVCGYANKTFRTFSNPCTMRAESKDTGVSWTGFCPGTCDVIAKYFLKATTRKPENTIPKEVSTAVALAGAAPSPQTRIRVQTNTNNTFHGPYVEGNLYNEGPIHNYYGFVVPNWQGPIPYAGDIPNSNNGEIVSEDVVESEVEPVVLGGIAFNTVHQAISFITNFVNELLQYIKGLRGI
ncbi:uncharacterized protein LOC142237530 [Haematobia irritans]|uniref:uncharacterized protein LOC142237530 n=1 Tax=Haematobia irritans TaxID=7368 RepID=UPI003F50625B